jgi:hypothetical protein
MQSVRYHTAFSTTYKTCVLQRPFLYYEADFCTTEKTLVLQILFEYCNDYVRLQYR